ncbi:MAG: Flp family type IVb pilin [Rhodospirillales bacterium]|nr:Flp family type IVb pilin [Rhodospirillales bacterium]
MFVQFLISLSLFLQKFRAECAGATAIEYALIAAGIALAISAVVYTLGDEILAIFEDVEAGFAGP